MHALLKTTVIAIKSFLIESDEKIQSGPNIRDAYDIKRMMMLVVYALLPCTIMAIINTGMQTYVLSTFDPELFLAYSEASLTISSYFAFIFHHFSPIVYYGLKILLPSLIIIYTVGGIVEIVFATIHKKPLSEGFLVTGLLITLILPPTLPYWMIALGTAIGLILGKELFGGTGMNVLNPALVCRCFLFFTFPAYMSGEVWVGTHSLGARQSIAEIALKQDSPYTTGQSVLVHASPSSEVKKIHSEAIRIQRGHDSRHKTVVAEILKQYDPTLNINDLSERQLLEFVTSPSGLMLDKEYYNQAYTFAVLQNGEGTWRDQNLFMGNQIGSLGETSTLCCLLGALFLIFCGVASWHIMAAVLIGAYFTALAFQFGSTLNSHSGLLHPALYAFPAYKHLLVGSLAFGLVFMATDPVSSPVMRSSQWMYGILIGMLTIIIRVINPAFPEGVMLAILFGNVFAPLFDRISLNLSRKKEMKRRRRLVSG